MLNAAPIRPPEGFFELFKPRPILSPDKEVAISLNQESNICLCDEPEGVTPRILQKCYIENLSYNPTFSLRIMCINQSYPTPL